MHRVPCTTALTNKFLDQHSKFNKLPMKMEFLGSQLFGLSSCLEILAFSPKRYFWNSSYCMEILVIRQILVIPIRLVLITQ